MSHAGPKAGWHGVAGLRCQRGQAAIYGLFVIIGATAVLFFLFNAGQLTREKTKLVNTSDAVAYSAGVMNARLLNFDAYTNRAMLANTVAIAQLVSLSSWIKYVQTMAAGAAGVDLLKYPEFYLSYQAALRGVAPLSTVDAGLERLERATDGIIGVLKTAQVTAHASFVASRAAVMDEVAAANYRNDGDIGVEQMVTTAPDVGTFVSRYAGDQRTRFAEAATTSAKKDDFVKRRSWLLPALYPDGCPYRFDWLSRRGGTNLIGFDEWKAMDTLSEWRWKMDKYGNCDLSEYPVGYGMQAAADTLAADSDFSRYDSSRIINPVASALADTTNSSDWGYKGLPAFYDLSEHALGEADPRLRFVVRLRRAIDQTVTSEGRSQIRNSGDDNRLAKALNNYHAAPAGENELVAIAASEVFFDRSDDNAYGASLGKPRELASLFNPFWRVHLVASDADAHAAQGLQGAALPQ